MVYSLFWIVEGVFLLILGIILLIENGLSDWGYWGSKFIPAFIIILGIVDLIMVPRIIKYFKRRKS